MALGAPEDGDNGPTAMVQQPLLHRRLSRRAPFESYKDQEPQHQTRPSPQPGNEYTKAPHQHQQAALSLRLQALLNPLRQLSRRAADVLLLDFEFANRPLMFRLNQAFKRLAFSLRSDLQMLRDRLLSQQARDKFSSALELLSLFLLLARTVAASGVRKIIRQLLGQMNRLRATPGQIKQTLQQLGKKQRKD